MTARERFLARLGHTEDDHRPANISDTDGKWVAAMTRRLARHPSLPRVRGLDSCGWWICDEADDGRIPWNELDAALAVLQGHGHDPWSPHAANIAREVQRLENWGSERHDYERWLSAIVSVDLDGDAKRLQQKALDELRPLLENARNAKPDQRRRGPTTKTGPRAALALGESLGWALEDVAAILLLVGAERGTFDSLKKSLKDMYNRGRIAIVKD